MQEKNEAVGTLPSIYGFGGLFLESVKIEILAQALARMAECL